MRQCAGEGQPGRHPDGGVQRRRHHHRQAEPAGDVQRGTHPAERRDLDHRDVGGAERGHPLRVAGQPDRLVGGDRNPATAPDLGELFDGAARLLDVLQATGGVV